MTDAAIITIEGLNKIQNPYFGVYNSEIGNLNYAYANKRIKELAFRH